MAPECILYKQYSEASDAFAYGVTLWVSQSIKQIFSVSWKPNIYLKHFKEMVTRKLPWKGLEPAQVVIAVARKNTRLEIPPDTDPIIKNIITSVWRAAPEKRYCFLSSLSSLSLSLSLSHSSFSLSRSSFSFFLFPHSLSLLLSLSSVSFFGLPFLFLFTCLSHLHSSIE